MVINEGLRLLFNAVYYLRRVICFLCSSLFKMSRLPVDRSRRRLFVQKTLGLRPRQQAPYNPAIQSVNQTGCNHLIPPRETCIAPQSRSQSTGELFAAFRSFSHKTHVGPKLPPDSHLHHTPRRWRRHLRPPRARQRALPKKKRQHAPKEWWRKDR